MNPALNNYRFTPIRREFPQQINPNQLVQKNTRKPESAQNNMYKILDKMRRQMSVYTDKTQWLFEGQQQSPSIQHIFPHNGI